MDVAKHYKKQHLQRSLTCPKRLKLQLESVRLVVSYSGSVPSTYSRWSRPSRVPMESRSSMAPGAYICPRNYIINDASINKVIICKIYCFETTTFKLTTIFRMCKTSWNIKSLGPLANAYHFKSPGLRSVLRATTLLMIWSKQTTRACIWALNACLDCHYIQVLQAF